MSGHREFDAGRLQLFWRGRSLNLTNAIRESVLVGAVVGGLCYRSEIVTWWGAARSCDREVSPML